MSRARQEGSGAGVRARSAILRGLHFIASTAADPEHFRAYGHDYVFALSRMSVTSHDPIVRERARAIGRGCAARWRATLPVLHADADADDVANAVLGDLGARSLGLVDERLKPSLLQMAARFTAEDFFWFDPTIEGPPCDVPVDCTCGADNRRGIRRCHACGARLRMMSRYEALVVALIRSYVGDLYGISVGAPYSEVVKWMAVLRPYPCSGGDDDRVWSIYAVTHLIYTLNDYNLYSVRVEWLPAEFRFLQDNLEEVIANDDPDAVGEILDSLKAFGLTDGSAAVARGTEYLLSSQNADGSWGACDASDLYRQYHATLAAINGLDDYLWPDEAPRFARLERLLMLPDVRGPGSHPGHVLRSL